MASGEMAKEDFETFLSESLALAAASTVEGGLIYACMDWRGLEPMTAAARVNGLELLNLCVWVKTNGGMGSFYRSRHELVFVFRNGKASHLNNVQLGRFGRNRTNVWNYPGANSFARGKGSNAFDSHPTVKPIRLVADALLDCTKRGDAILDPFLGSGTTLLAAERTERQCFGIELDPLHVETAIRRWETMTGHVATNQNGLSLSDLCFAKNVAK
jgi:DNA modification methylase